MKICQDEGFVDGVVLSKKECFYSIKEYISENIINLKSDRELPLNKILRITVFGEWYLSEYGAMPLDGCTVVKFEELDGTSIMDSMNAIAALEHEGWNSFADPIAEWKKIRGCK